MQDRIRSLSLAALLVCAFTLPVMSQVVVCPGEPVQFQLQDNYYGVKTWEYSPDGVQWSPTTVQENTPFTITPELAGYYRVRFEDVDCGVSYTSNVVQLMEPMALELFSIYSDQVLPVSIDPVLWLSDTTGLSDLVYVVNGTSYPVELLYQPVPNPGADFSVYAMGVDAVGCTVYSDTIAFDVENTNIAGNGIVDPLASVDLAGVEVRSNVGQTALGMGGLFALNYNLDFGSDLIIAYRPGPDTTLVALRSVYTPGEYLLLNEESTAWTLVLLHPDVAPLAIEDHAALRAWLEEQPEFSSLVGLLQDDLENTGSVQFDTPDKIVLMEALVDGILAIGADGFRAPAGAIPTLSRSANGFYLTYAHENHNRIYVARGYAGGTAVSSPIAFRGEGSPGVFVNAVMNFVAYALQQAPLFTFRDNNQISLADMAVPAAVAELDIHLVNGLGSSTASEALLAQRYNLHLFAYKIVLSMGSKLMNEGMSCALAVGEVIAENYAQLQAQGNTPSILTLVGTTITQVRNTLLECAGDFGYDILFTVAGLSFLSTVRSASWYLEFFYEAYTTEPELVNHFTKVGSRFAGVLNVRSNVTEISVGIPGSLVQTSPGFQGLTKPAFYLVQYDLVERPNGNALSISDTVDFFQQGLEMHVTATRTQEVVFDGVAHPNGEFQAAMLPLNQLNWKLANNAPVGPLAELNVEVWYGNQNFPNTIYGYDEGKLGFFAFIEEAVLTVVSGDGQSGQSNTALPAPCVVQLRAQSGVNIPDYPLQVEVTAGGGSVSTNTATTDGSGNASVLWTLGGEGEQTMRFVVEPTDGLELEEIEYTAVLEPGDSIVTYASAQTFPVSYDLGCCGEGYMLVVTCNSSSMGLTLTFQNDLPTAAVLVVTHGSGSGSFGESCNAEGMADCTGPLGCVGGLSGCGYFYCNTTPEITKSDFVFTGLNFSSISDPGIFGSVAPDGSSVTITYAGTARQLTP